LSVAFKEIGGSPVERYTRSGFFAQRRFLVAWEDREQFAVEVLGRAATHAEVGPVQYPGKPTAVAVSLRYEPLDADAPDNKPLADLAHDLNSYDGQYAVATVEYRLLNTQDREDGPTNEPGTHLTYRMKPARVDLEIRPAGWVWADQPTVPLPDDLTLTKTVPLTEHHLVWHEVIRPPWAVIQSLQGTVNAEEFLGCSPGTLLFVGADVNKLFRAGLESEPSEFAWQIHYLFLERAIKHGGAVYGWNHVYRDSPPGWAEPVSGSLKLYDEADFQPLFRSGE